MREVYFRWGAGILCLMLLILPSVLPPPVIEDGATEKAMLPPCDVEEGLPFIENDEVTCYWGCLLYTSPSPRDATLSRMPSSA